MLSSVAYTKVSSKAPQTVLRRVMMCSLKGSNTKVMTTAPMP